MAVSPMLAKYDSYDGSFLWEKIIDICIWDFCFGIGANTKRQLSLNIKEPHDFAF